jgi:two-component system, NarL family, invasion response regulator UvrY
MARLGASRLIRVLIADANTLIRTGIRTLLCQYLEQSRTTHEINEVATGAEVLTSLRSRQPWNLCLVDLSLPQRGGLEILRHIRKTGLATRILVLMSYPDRQYAPVALRLGARGFLLKDCAREDLLAAVRAVTDGGCYVSPQLSEQLIATTFDESPSYAKLSQREFQIFQKLACGTAITVIGKELSISPKSVSTYRSRILEKMRCRNNAEITQYAMREGLI